MNLKIMNMTLKAFIGICLICISFFLYILAPDEFSISVVTFYLLYYLILVLFLHKAKKIKNHFCFETIFSITYLFVYFIYPVFVFSVNKTRIFIFNYAFNERNICKATTLALIGYSCFALGNICFRTKDKKSLLIKERVFIPKKETIITVVLGVLFSLIVYKFFVLGFSRYNSHSIEISGMWDYIEIIHHGAFMAAIVIEYYKLYRAAYSVRTMLLKKPVFWTIIILDIITYLLAGERTQPLYYVLAIVGGYYLIKNKLPAIKLLIICSVGIIVLNAVGMMRVGDEGSLSIIDATSDLIFNNYTLYLGYDYVEMNGCVLFPLIGGLIRCVPFALGIVCRLFNISASKVSSADFFTDLLFGSKRPIGVGTNIISSLYLSLGLVGIVIFMFILGRIVAKYEIISKHSSIYKLAIYLELIGVSIYYVRSEFFYPLANIVWTCILLYIFCLLSSQRIYMMENP